MNDSMTDDEFFWKEHVEEMGEEVLRRLYNIGVKDYAHQERIANLIAETYDTYPEANDLADYLGLEEKHILCYLNTQESMEKYDKIIDRRMSNYYT